MEKTFISAANHVTIFQSTSYVARSHNGINSTKFISSRSWSTIQQETKFQHTAAFHSKRQNHLHTTRQSPNQKRRSLSMEPGLIINTHLPSTYHKFIMIPPLLHTNVHRGMELLTRLALSPLHPSALTTEIHNRGQVKVPSNFVRSTCDVG